MNQGNPAHVYVRRRHRHPAIVVDINLDDPNVARGMDRLLADIGLVGRIDAEQRRQHGGDLIGREIEEMDAERWDGMS